MAFRLFGRRIRVTVGDLRVCDLDPNAGYTPLQTSAVNEGRNLDVQFSTQSHTKAEPLPTELTIYGLNELTRRQLTTNNDLARRIAWQNYQAVQVGDVLVEPDNQAQIDEVTQSLVSQGATVIIEAGYDRDFGTIARAQILPDGLEHERLAGGGWVTRIKAQDTRLPWANAFVSEEVAPGVTLADMNQALRISEQYLTGEIGAAEVNAQIPGLIERVDGAGYENGRVLHGATRNENAALMQTLGIRGPFLINSQPTFVSANTSVYGVAIVLQMPEDGNGPVQNPGGLLRYKILPRGYVETTSLLNYRLIAGRQVQLLESDGTPVGGGFYRVDFSEHTGSSFEPIYHTSCILRPVTVEPENNA